MLSNTRFNSAIASMNKEQLWALKVVIMAERYIKTVGTVPPDKSLMLTAYEQALRLDDSLKDVSPIFDIKA